MMKRRALPWLVLVLAACTEENPDRVTLPADAPDAAACVDGAACDDGDPCTAGDRCERGACRGEPRICDDDDPCTVDRCDPTSGMCFGEAMPVQGREGEPGDARCGDGVDGDCDGLVDGADADCRRCADDAECVDANPCTRERCARGRCESVNADDGVACDDGDACTEGDTCGGGRCGGAPRACPPVEGACMAPACAEGECGAAPLPDGTACDDGDPCTTEDACVSGTCDGKPRDCGELDGPCVRGVCAEGGCRAAPRVDGTPCDDGLCQPDAICVAGECAGDRVDCSRLDGVCRVGVCDPDTGGCGAAAAPAGTACDDGDPCTTDDACGEGGCRGTPRACDGGPCGVGRCDAATGACVVDPAPNGTPCDDGEGCTEGDRCVDGACLGAERACPAPDAPCRVAACDPRTGECGRAPAPDGTACDDGDRCTTGDACTAGRCEGAAPACDDGDACTVDRCDPVSGACVHPLQPGDGREGAPGDPACANGRDDDCDGLADAADADCRRCAADADCDDGDPCTEFSCDAGTCVARPSAADGRACDDGDACTQGDTCRAERCEGAAVDCSGLDGPCARGVCALGACVPRPVGDGAACDDGDACTQGDACREGSCAGRPRDCSALDDECRVGRCAEGGCRAEPRPAATPCNDGQPCTVRDACEAGECRGAPADCGAFDGACVVGQCDPTSGDCAPVRLPDGSGCDDGDPCTVDDACTLGACAGRPRDCAALDGACVVGRCDEGACRAVPRRDGTPCDDGSACTAEDACGGGECRGAARDCAALDGPCVVGACDPATGRCVAVPAGDGAPCDDGLRCTADDRCAEGGCVGAPVDCRRLDGPCATGACDPATGACVARPLPDDTACDDGQACTDGDACRDGACRGDGLDCGGLNDACVVGVCDPAAGDCRAEPLADGSPCDPGDLCTVGATCERGACVGAPRDCSALDGPCVTGACDPATGACVAERAAEGTACEDGNPCTVEERCEAGRCLGGARSCAHLDGPCTVGRCDAQQGCVAVPRADGAACDTGNPCLTEEACRAGVCTGTPIACVDADPNPCRAAACNPATGRCEPADVADGTACDDGAFCTTGDACRAGQCRGAARDCNPPGEPCRVGTCDERRDRCDVGNRPNGTACDDGQFCSVGDRCYSGTCRPTGSRDCPDANAGCARGVCDEQGDRCTQVAAPEGTLCFDGNPCTLGDTCRGGDCAAGRDICP